MYMKHYRRETQSDFTRHLVLKVLLRFRKYPLYNITINEITIQVYTHIFSVLKVKTCKVVFIIDIHV